MNIWIFNHYAVGPNSSGITRHYDLAKELVKLGHNVTIFASSFNHQKRKEEQIYLNRKLYVKKVYEGVTFYWIKTTAYQKNDFRRVANMFSYTRHAYSLAKSINKKPDYVIGSLMHPLAPMLGLRIAKKFKAKFIFEERDLWPQSLIDLGKVSKNNPIVYILAKLEKYLYEKSNKIMILFENAENYISNKGVNRNKIMYIPNGVDITRYDIANRELPMETLKVLEGLKEKFIAVYTGAHGMANNLDVIMEAAEKLKSDSEIHFLLVGDGPEKKRLLEIQKERRLHNITFLDSMPKEDIPLLLKRCTVGLLPLQNSPVFKWGISPNKMYDYMAASLPVLLLCDLEDSTLQASNSGFIIKSNFSESLCHLLNELKNDNKLVETKGTNGKKYLEEYHTWDKLALKFIENIK